MAGYTDLEKLNWKLKEAAILRKFEARKINPNDCELEGATLMGNSNTNAYSPSNSRDVGWQNDPDPTMPSLNPFAQARNINSRRQSEIAEDLKLDMVDIIRLEQGVLTEIPDATIKYYELELKLPEGWRAGYRMFQKTVRRSAPRPIFGVWRMPPGELTFRRWRVYNWPTLSQMGFCKALCVHPSSLYAIEKDARNTVPPIILTALIEAQIMSEEQARQFAFRIRQAATAYQRRAPHAKVD